MEKGADMDRLLATLGSLTNVSPGSGMMEEPHNGLQGKLAGRPSPARSCMWYAVVDIFTRPRKLLYE